MMTLITAIADWTVSVQRSIRVPVPAAPIPEAYVEVFCICHTGWTFPVWIDTLPVVVLCPIRKNYVSVLIDFQVWYRGILFKPLVVIVERYPHDVVYAAVCVVLRLRYHRRV